MTNTGLLECISSPDSAYFVENR